MEKFSSKRSPATMILPWIRNWLKQTKRRSSHGSGLRRRLRSRSLCIEALEDRTLLSTVTAAITGPTGAQEGGQAITLMGSATDSNSTDQNAGFDYEWVVTDQNGNQIASQSSPSIGAYAPDAFMFSPTEGGTYTISLTATDIENSTSPTATQTVTVSDAALHATKGPDINTDVNGATLVEGGTTGLVTLATFTDENTGAPLTDFTATINWGDGSPPVTGDYTDGTIAVNVDHNGQTIPGSFLVQASHQYTEEGAFAVGVTISDVDSASVSLSGSSAVQATVGDVQLSNAAGKNINGTAGHSTGDVVVATFTDPAGSEAVGNYNASITWGDTDAHGNPLTSGGTVVDLGNGKFEVHGSHTYAAPGSYSLSTSITHEQVSPVTANAVAGIDAITFNPANMNINVGQNATFTAASANNSDTVQWQLSSDGGHTFKPLSDGGVYSGTATTTLTITNAPTSLNGAEYEAIFSTAAGALTTSAAILTVDYVTVNPAAATIVVGQKATFQAATANPTNSDTVQWQVSSDGGHTFGPLSDGGLYSGTATTTLTISNVPGSLNGAEYEAVFSNKAGTLTTSAATMTVIVKGQVYILNSSASGALTVSGDALLRADSLVQVNSSSSTAVQLSGAADVNAAKIQIVGGYRVSGHADFDEKPATHAASSGDPLAAVVAPTGGASQGAITLGSHSTRTINPGVYSSITVSGSARLILNPGVYLIGSGGITVSGSAKVSGKGVMLYNAGILTIGGKASVDLTAAASGPYANIAIFQARDDAHGVTVNGDANLNLHGGVLYAANSKCLVSVSGDATITAALVVNELNLSGDAEINPPQHAANQVRRHR
jgi:hypothetical protein